MTMILEKNRAQSENMFRNGLNEEVRGGRHCSEKDAKLLLLAGSRLSFLRTLRRFLLGRSEGVCSLLVLLHGHAIAVGHHLLVGLASLGRAVVAVDSSADRTSHTDSPFGVLFSTALLRQRLSVFQISDNATNIVYSCLEVKPKQKSASLVFFIS